VAFFFLATHLRAQIEPAAGNWKTWFITSGKDWRLPQPSAYKQEIAQVLSRQQNLDAAGLQQILYWNAGAPGYRWQEMISKLWMTDTTYNGALSNMLLGVATYDATIAAWDTKYAYKRPRPFAACLRSCIRIFFRQIALISRRKPKMERNPVFRAASIFAPTTKWAWNWATK
jgi:hypothetical protein